jgi:intraflagellar transport protein 172
MQATFEKFMIITHLTALKEFCSQKKELQSFAAKQSIALLRYCDLIAPDRAFYDAGLAAKVCSQYQY